MLFLQNNSTLAQGTGEKGLVFISITIWIQEFFEDFFIIALISNIGGVGPWRGSALSKCSCFICAIY